MKATINDPKYRTVNRNATAGSADDWTRFNPWRAPGNAPVFDPCGRAGGAASATPGHGEYTNTRYAKFGDLGSKVLPKYPTGTVWAAGSAVETMQSIRANHGGSLGSVGVAVPSHAGLFARRRRLSVQERSVCVCVFTIRAHL